MAGLPLAVLRARRVTAVLLGLAAAVTAAPAAAHAPVPGLDGFYLGLLHPLRTPAPLIGLLALGLLLGRAGAARFRRAWPAFAVAVFVAAVLAFVVPALVRGDREVEVALLGLVLVLGLLGTLPRPPPGAVLVGLALAAGAIIGLVVMPDPGALRARIITTAGVFAGTNLAVLGLFGVVDTLTATLRARWFAIALRAASAWLAAAAILLLAFAFV